MIYHNLPFVKFGIGGNFGMKFFCFVLCGIFTFVSLILFSLTLVSLALFSIVASGSLFNFSVVAIYLIEFWISFPYITCGTCSFAFLVFKISKISLIACLRKVSVFDYGNGIRSGMKSTV